MNQPAPTPVEAAPKKPTRREAIAKLGRALASADPGTLAALRRAKPASPPAVFYRLVVDVLDDILAEAGPFRDEVETRWALIASAMAAAQGFLAAVPLGEALAGAGVSEMRFLRLLEADSSQLPKLVGNVVHQLVQRGQPFDPNDLANLVLARDDDREPRRRIARSYYRHADPDRSPS